MSSISLTLADLKTLMAPQPATAKDSPFQVGTAYLIRTVTFTWLGRVQVVCGDFLILNEAAWIADTGRYSQALSGPIEKLPSSEIEPSPRPVIINAATIVDAVEYPFAISHEVK